MFRQTASSYRIAYEGRVPRTTSSVCVCLCVCVSQHSFRPRLSTALNVHGTKASHDGSSARTNNRQLFSNWFRCKSLRVRRGRCGNVCFHRHQNWVPLSFFSSFLNNVPTYQNCKTLLNRVICPMQNDKSTARDENGHFLQQNESGANLPQEQLVLGRAQCQYITRNNSILDAVTQV